MTTKELIHAEIETLDEAALDELYAVIKNFAQSKRQSESEGIMSKLRRIQIEAPEDFSANFELYASGEKRV